MIPTLKGADNDFPVWLGYNDTPIWLEEEGHEDSNGYDCPFYVMGWGCGAQGLSHGELFAEEGECTVAGAGDVVVDAPLPGEVP